MICKTLIKQILPVSVNVATPMKIPECKMCIHLIKEDYFLQNTFSTVKIIGFCQQKNTYIKKNQSPICKGHLFKHYLDRLLD